MFWVSRDRRYNKLPEVFRHSRDPPRSNPFLVAGSDGAPFPDSIQGGGDHSMRALT